MAAARKIKKACTCGFSTIPKLKMRLMLAIVAMVLFCNAGCIHKYNPESCLNTYCAQLTFATDEIGKSRWYLLTGYTLQMHLYSENPAPYEKPEYLGTIELTCEEKKREIPVPANRTLFLSIKYMSIVMGEIKHCEIPLSFIPYMRESYTVLFKQTCRARIIDNKTNEEIPSAPIESGRSDIYGERMGNRF